MFDRDRVDSDRRLEHPSVVRPEWAGQGADTVDRPVCLDTPERFSAIGQGYQNFSRTPGEPPGRDEDIEILAGGVRLAGHLTAPVEMSGIVVFAHGSGSSRLSPRNQFVADLMNQAGLGTLLFDLLTVDEEADRTNVFDIELLGGRLVDVTRWLATQPEGRNARIGYFGASTGAAAALWASVDADVDIDAVVSRGGRPDLAGPRLPLVTAPTLLIVGSRDEIVLNLNREAQTHLECENRLAVVAGATHLFQEPGTLREAAGLARDWFLDHLAPV